MCANPVEDSMRVGVMADSHGNAGSIQAALLLFRDQGCRRIYHLGDICDSLRPGTVDACIEPLQAAAAIAIRGNNDHSLLANLNGRQDARFSEESRCFLEKLPLKVTFGDAELVHSLPFTEELGLASMIGPLGAAVASRFFESTNRPVLFRGHSHSPELTWSQNGQTLTRPLPPAQRIDLAALMPCIVTCGALADGYCLIWEPARQAVTSMTLSAIHV